MTDQPKDHEIIKEIKHPITPPTKPIELGLTWYGTIFQVKTIKNSTYYVPGQWMTRDVARQCCEIPNWTVIMTDNQIIATLLGSTLGKLPI